MRKIQICSRYSAETDEEIAGNELAALGFGRWAHLRQHVYPMAPHLLYTRWLDDSVQQERTVGMETSLIWLQCCDELWVLLDERGVSGGMGAEISHARKHRIVVRTFRAVVDGYVETKERV